MQAAQQAFAIQKSCVVPDLKDLSSLQARKGWGNQSSTTMPCQVHLLTVNQFVLTSNFMHPLHPTYALQWAMSEIQVMWAELPKTKRCSSLPFSAHLCLPTSCKEMKEQWPQWTSKQPLEKAGEENPLPPPVWGGMGRSYLHRPRQLFRRPCLCCFILKRSLKGRRDPHPG